jgi:hypothetical protein
VFLIAVELGLSNIVDNHVPDFLATMLLRQETLGECCRIDFGEVFVLGNGEHFLLSQTAERNTIVKRDHGTGLCSLEISYSYEAEVGGSSIRAGSRCTGAAFALDSSRFASARSCCSRPKCRSRDSGDRHMPA